MTLAEILRKSCAANNLGTTGSSAVLLARLIKSNKKTPAKSPAPKKTIAKKTSNKPTKKAAAKKQPAKKPAAKKCTGGKCKPHAAFKPTASGGCRLSAAYYFYDVCDGKISRCTPQPIVQPDGCVKLKQILSSTGRAASGARAGCSRSLPPLVEGQDHVSGCESCLFASAC